MNQNNENEIPVNDALPPFNKGGEMFKNPRSHNPNRNMHTQGRTYYNKGRPGHYAGTNMVKHNLKGEGAGGGVGTYAKNIVNSHRSTNYNQNGSYHCNSNTGNNNGLSSATPEGTKIEEISYGIKEPKLNTRVNYKKDLKSNYGPNGYTSPINNRIDIRHDGRENPMINKDIKHNIYGNSNKQNNMNSNSHKIDGNNASMNKMLDTGSVNYKMNVSEDSKYGKNVESGMGVGGGGYPVRYGKHIKNSNGMDRNNNYQHENRYAGPTKYGKNNYSTIKKNSGGNLVNPMSSTNVVEKDLKRDSGEGYKMNQNSKDLNNFNTISNNGGSSPVILSNDSIGNEIYPSSVSMEHTTMLMSSSVEMKHSNELGSSNYSIHGKNRVLVGRELLADSSQGSTQAFSALATPNAGSIVGGSVPMSGISNIIAPKGGIEEVNINHSGTVNTSNSNHTTDNTSPYNNTDGNGEHNKEQPKPNDKDNSRDTNHHNNSNSSNNNNNSNSSSNNNNNNNNNRDNNNNNRKESPSSNASSQINLSLDAAFYYNFNDFANYMYRDENMLTLFYIRKNYLKVESKEEYVNENDKIKCSIMWRFGNEQISVCGYHPNNKKASRKACIKNLLVSLKNISLMELDQMTKWMINTLNVAFPVEDKNMYTQFNKNHNAYYSTLEWIVNGKKYEGMGIHEYEKIAELIATQNLYMLLVHKKEELAREAQMIANQLYKGGVPMQGNYGTGVAGTVGGVGVGVGVGSYNNNNNYGGNMGSNMRGGNMQMQSNKNYDNGSYDVNNNNKNAQYNKMSRSPSMYDRNMINSGTSISSSGLNKSTNDIMMMGMNSHVPSYEDLGSRPMPQGDIMMGNSVIPPPPPPPKEPYNNNAYMNSNTVENGNVVELPQQIHSYNLTKQDAGSIQILRNNITVRYKIAQTENVELINNSVYRCTLHWEWKNGKITCKATSVGYSTVKLLAKAEAAYDMLIKNNLMEYVSSDDRKNAQAIRDLIPKDLKKALHKSIEFIRNCDSDAWSIFLISLLRTLIAEGTYEDVCRLMEVLVEVTKKGREEEKEQEEKNKELKKNSSTESLLKMNPSQGQGTPNATVSISQGINGDKTIELPSGIPSVVLNKQCNKLVSVDLWEKLIDECVVSMNDKLGVYVINALADVELDYSIFISKCAHNYYKKYRIMLALELQANLVQSMNEKKDFEHLHENKSLLVKLKPATVPVLSFTCILTAEEKEWLKTTQMKEDDIVLLKPVDMQRKDDDAWSHVIIGTITSQKYDQTIYNINIRTIGADKSKNTQIKHTVYRLYLLLNIVTHERMLQVLRAITYVSALPTQVQSPYYFTPEIRFLILHTYNKYSRHIAQTGKVDEEVAKHEEIRMEFSGATEGLSMFPTKSLSGDLQNENCFQTCEVSSGNGGNPSGMETTNTKNPYEDMLNEALNKQIDSENLEEIDKFLIDSVNIPTNLPLNDSQKLACISALTRRLTLIQGPPGTGKTHVACAIIDCWHRQNSSKKILAVADSNVAANNLVEGLKKRNIKAVRVGAGTDSDFHEEAIMKFSRYKDLLELRKKNMQKEAKMMKALLFVEAVKKYNVVIATCVGSGHEIFDNEKFERVIIDECAQSIEPSNLIPLGHYCNNLVLIGDHKQLPPTIISTEATKLGLDQSLLERFICAKIAPVHLLSTQRRMHLTICAFPNMHFYDNKLKSANVTEENRPIIKGFLWPNPKCRVAFVDVSLGKNGSKFESAYGTSKFNLYEVDPLICVLKSIINEGCVSIDEVGILTAYDAQKMKLKKAVQEAFPNEAAYRIEIDSVDGFQGKEKDLILFSAVRSNANNELGFLRDPRRMNVMLTRAKRGVILFGDQFTLANDTANWLPWLKWIASRRAIIHISKLNEHLETTDYFMLERMSKINKGVNLRNLDVTDHYYFYGDDSGFSNDYHTEQVEYDDSHFTNADQNNNNNNNNAVGARDRAEQTTEEPVENWEDLF